MSLKKNNHDKLGFVTSLNSIQKLSNTLIDQFQERQQEPIVDVRQQIVLLKDQVHQITEMKKLFETTLDTLKQFGASKEAEFEGLCELHSSPLVALGDEALSEIFAFLDEEDLVLCETSSIRWRQIINQRRHWDRLATQRNQKEEGRHDVTYSGEKCAMLGRKAQFAKRLRGRGVVALPPTQKIRRYEETGEEAFVKVYWNLTKNVVWQGLISDLHIDANVVGLSLQHSPASPFFDWEALSEYQAWLQSDEYNDEDEPDRLGKLLGTWDLSFTILWGDEVLLAAQGCGRIQYDEDLEYHYVVLCTQLDILARVAILHDELALEVYYRDHVIHQQEDYLYRSYF